MMMLAATMSTLPQICSNRTLAILSDVSIFISKWMLDAGHSLPLLLVRQSQPLLTGAGLMQGLLLVMAVLASKTWIPSTCHLGWGLSPGSHCNPSTIV